MTAPVCRQCSADIESKRLGRVEGEDGGIKTALVGVPIVECTNGHKRFPTPEFPLELIQRLLKVDGIVTAPPAVEKGLFRKHRHCPACGKALAGESASSSSARADLDLPDAEPVAAEVAVPLYRCTGCGKDATLPESALARGIMQAVANAFRSANIPPG
jgi:hypothetical protein